MKETTCSSGHIYDSDMYATCPYCSGSSRAIDFDSDSFKTTIGRTQMGNGDIGKTFMDTGSEDSYDGKTVAPRGFLSEDEPSEDTGKTIGVFETPEFSKGIEPVVGWLVCIDGPEKGKDYRILCKVNTIGRSSDMDIFINDRTVSRDKNARISYEPRNNDFHLFPAESSNNIYLNNKAVYVPTQLSAYDLIEFGNSKMLFIPLCGEKFQWDIESSTAQ